MPGSACSKSRALAAEILEVELKSKQSSVSTLTQNLLVQRKPDQLFSSEQHCRPYQAGHSIEHNHRVACAAGFTFKYFPGVAAHRLELIWLVDMGMMRGEHA